MFNWLKKKPLGVQQRILPFISIEMNGESAKFYAHLPDDGDNIELFGKIMVAMVSGKLNSYLIQAIAVAGQDENKSMLAAALIDSIKIGESKPSNGPRISASEAFSPKALEFQE